MNGFGSEKAVDLTLVKSFCEHDSHVFSTAFLSLSCEKEQGSCPDSVLQPRPFRRWELFPPLTQPRGGPSARTSIGFIRLSLYFWHAELVSSRTRPLGGAIVVVITALIAGYVHITQVKLSPGPLVPAGPVRPVQNSLISRQVAV